MSVAICKIIPTTNDPITGIPSNERLLTMDQCPI